MPALPVERWLYGATFAALIGGAWVSLWLLGASAYAPYLGHHVTDDPLGWPLAARMAAFVAGWTVMSIAMMLPSSLPLITVFHTMTRARWRLVGLLVAGYLGTWALFGLLALVADAVLHAVVDRAVADPAQAAALIGPALLVTAGLFQFSPLKYACLAECRSPVGFLTQHWRGTRRAWQAFELGVRHGLFCVGCCWILMLLMFAVGGAHLGWMLVLGAIMFVEKAVRWGVWVSKPVGVVLAAWGVALLARAPGVPNPF